MKCDITCIVCPMGCRITVYEIDNKYLVSGNTCRRGEKYGVEEVTNPKRVITSTVRLEGSYLNLLPVKSSSSIPKELMFDVMDALKDITAYAPIMVGDIIIKDILGSGVDIVSSKTMI